MFKIKNYTLGIDRGGLLLFAAVTVPTLIWLVLPAPNDALKAESKTLLDAVSNILRVLLMFALCFIQNRKAQRPMKKPPLTLTAVCAAAYFAFWAIYYAGFAGRPVIFALCALPCCAFIAFSVGRKNTPALIFSAAFTVCHTAATILNFILP